MQFPHGEQKIILHRRGEVTGRDAYGKDIYGPDQVYLIPGCAFWPEGSVELVQGRETVIDTDTVAIPPENLPAGVTAILPTDEITVNGERRGVDGRPETLVNPFTGIRSPITVRLKEVTG